jgi:hypothetical protein
MSFPLDPYPMLLLFRYSGVVVTGDAIPSHFHPACCKWNHAHPLTQFVSGSPLLLNCKTSRIARYAFAARMPVHTPSSVWKNFSPLWPYTRSRQAAVAVQSLFGAGLLSSLSTGDTRSTHHFSAFRSDIGRLNMVPLPAPLSYLIPLPPPPHPQTPWFYFASYEVLIMPGSSHIFGFLPCTNLRVVNPDKPRSLTFDAEIVVATDCTGHVETTTAVLTHFQDATEEPFVDGGLYYVSGRVASIDDSFAVGDGFSKDMYDFVVDAEKV